MTGSLGFATDLALLRLQGAAVEHGDGAVVVRMPGNPGFRWGNFLLVDSAEASPEALAAAHRARFPAAGFVSIGVDDPAATLDDRWAHAGFSVERLVVLTADAPPVAPPAEGIRELTRDADWTAVRRIGAEESEEAADDAFESARLDERRRLVATGRAAWFVAEVGGGVVASLGIADAGDGVARFQDVQTLRAFRRRGLAGALLAAAGRAAAERFGSTRFVIVADADGGPAIGLYRRAGFTEVERQVQLERVDGQG